MYIKRKITYFLILFFITVCTFIYCDKFDSYLSTEEETTATSECQNDLDCIAKFGPGWTCKDGKCQQVIIPNKTRKNATASGIWGDDDGSIYISGHYYEIEPTGGNVSKVVSCIWVITPTGDHSFYQSRIDIFNPTLVEIDDYSNSGAYAITGDQDYLYVAGDYFFSINGSDAGSASYWWFEKASLSSTNINKGRFDLTITDTVLSVAIDPSNSLDPTSSTLYMCGYESTDYVNSKPCFWVNTTKYFLDSTDGQASGISFIPANPSYSAVDLISIAYADDNAGAKLANVPTASPLTFTSFMVDSDGVISQPFSIYVSQEQLSGTNVLGGFYLAGDYYNLSGNTIACYWLNGARYDVFPGTFYHSSASSIFKYNNSIYITGKYRKNINDVPFYYIINSLGEKRIFDLYTSSDAYSTSIYVNAYGVYITGNYYDGTTYLPCAWINGQKIDLKLN